MEKPTIEYDTRPLLGTVQVRRSPDRVVLTITPSFHRILLASSSMVITVVFCVGLYWGFLRGKMDETGWFVPALLGFVAIAAGMMAMIPVLFPITIEVTSSLVTIRFRKINQAQTLSWARSTILEFRFDKIRIGDALLRYSGLILRDNQTGDILLLRGARKEIEFIARELQAACGIKSGEPEFITIPPPPGCRYRRYRWRDGVVLVVQPKHQKLVMAVIILLAAGISAGTDYLLKRAMGDGFITDRTWALVLLGLILTGLLSALGIKAINQVRRALSRPSTTM